jgi:hypothetical protein
MCSLMESLHGRLRADGANIATTIVAPPLARTNLAGDSAIMDHIDRQLQSVGVPPSLVEPEQVAELVLDAIVNQRFWASVTPDTVLRVLLMPDRRVTPATSRPGSGMPVLIRS